MRIDDQAEIGSEPGSGNVFSDLGLEDADVLFARAQLGFYVHKLITGKGLKPREIASLLGIKQPEVSHLMNGHFSRFTADKLLDFLKRLDQKVTIQIRPHKPGEPFQEVGFGL
jgi:predicted XRE-type DNA-binding protein